MDIAVDIYVRTRGLEMDYRFLGEAPASFWWRAYRDWTDTEGPTILVESDQTGWRAYVAGMSSARRDRSDRPIQFNLALAGSHESTDAAARQLALAVIGRSVADLGAERGTKISGAALDRELTEPLVERMLANPDETTRDEASAAVRAAYGSAGADTGAERVAGEGAPPVWTAGVANSQARALFLAQVGRLIGGSHGQALVLNLLAGAADAADAVMTGQFASADGDLAVLTARPDSELDAEVTKLAAKKGLPPPDPQPYQESRLGRETRPARPVRPALLRPKVALPGGLVLLAVLAVVLFRIATAGPAPAAPTTRPTSQPTAKLTRARPPSPSPSLTPTARSTPHRTTSARPSVKPSARRHRRHRRVRRKKSKLA